MAEVFVVMAGLIGLGIGMMLGVGATLLAVRRLTEHLLFDTLFRRMIEGVIDFADVELGSDPDVDEV